MLFFGIVFGGAGMCGFVQTLAAGFAPPAEGRPPQSVWDTLLTLAGICPFIAIGVGILLGYLDAVQRATTVTLTDDTLAFRCVGVFGEHRYEWPLDEVAEVYVAPCAGPKGQINRKLVVQTFDGRTRGFLRGRKHTEVEGAVARLRKELGMETITL